MKKYHDSFSCREDLAAFSGNYSSEASEAFLDANVPPEDDILLAVYDGSGYEGSAFVLFKKDGKLFEVNGSHCSCYGLEGQWAPEETSWEALAIRGNYLTGSRELQELIKSHV